MPLAENMMRARSISVADRYDIGYSFSQADTWETVMSPASGSVLGLVYLIAYSTANNETISLRDQAGNGNIAYVELTAGEAAPLIQASAALPIDGALQAQVSSTGVSLSVWAVDLEEA